jgi:hypothetical protein
VIPGAVESLFEIAAKGSTAVKDFIRIVVLRKPSKRVGLLREVPAGCCGSVIEGSDHPAHVIDPNNGGASGTGVIDEQLPGLD